MSLFASVNGPSVTVSLPFATRTRAPFELGSRPPVCNTTPALIIFSVYWAIAVMSFGSGGAPAS